MPLRTSIARRPRTLLAAALAAALLPAAPLGAQSGSSDDDRPPIGPGRVAAQVGVGAVATPVGFVGGGLAARWLARGLGAGEDAASTWAYVGAWSGAALATAGGVALVGARGPGRGSYAAALGGAVAGGLGSWLLVRLNDRDDERSRPCRIGCVLSSVAVFALPSIGATIGYDLTREYE